MITGSSAIGAEWFLNGISNLQRQEIKTQQEISSGYQVQDAADSPAQTPALIALGSDLASAQSYQTNLGRVQAETTAADSGLSVSLTLIDQARALATQGASSTARASDRQNLATQVQSIQQQIVSIANTTVEGRFIFGGSQDQSGPYQYDVASATGVDALTVSTSNRAIVNPSGQTVYQSQTASTIFDPRDALGDPTTSNTFAALQNLYNALQANDPAATADALTSLETASTWVNRQQATYGTAEQRLSQEQNDTANRITSLKTQISGIRDTDITQAASDLARETTSQAAAFSAQAEIPRKSLFDYLG